MWKYEANTLAWLHIADGRFERALNLLTQVQQQAEQADRMFLMIESTILKGLALQSIGEREQAESSMMSALELAEPEGFIRTFVDLGDQVKDLLEMIRDGEGNESMGSEGDRFDPCRRVYPGDNQLYSGIGIKWCP